MPAKKDVRLTHVGVTWLQSLIKEQSRRCPPVATNLVDRLAISEPTAQSLHHKARGKQIYLRKIKKKQQT